MDPLTHGALGAVTAQSAARSNKREVLFALVLGWASGMLPDLDILLQSQTDPLFGLTYHRHFTHSIFMAPLLAFLPATFAYALFRRKLSFWRGYLFCLLGLVSHGLNDSATNYGTLLYWPFSETRVSWNLISVIDPTYTLILLLGLGLASFYRNPSWARIGLGLSFLYLAFCAYQLERATKIAESLAASRGHPIERLLVKPSIFNSILWKSLYESEGFFVTDAIRVLPFQKEKIYRGDRVPVFDLARDFPNLDEDSQQVRDIERFRWFSDDWLALRPGDASLIGDIRFSDLPNEHDPLWGIRIDENQSAEEHVRFESFRRVTAEKKQRFWRMLSGLSLENSKP